MQRDELIQITAATADFPMDCVEKIVDTLFDIITVTLQTQDWVELRTDFGSFVARNKGGDTLKDNIFRFMNRSVYIDMVCCICTFCGKSHGVAVGGGSVLI